MLFGIYPKALKIMSMQKPTHCFYSIFIHNCQNVEVTKMSLDKQTVVNPDNGILFSAKKK